MKRALIFTLVLLCSTLALARDLANGINQEEVVIKHLAAATRVLLDSPELFRGYDSGKFYIDETALVTVRDRGEFLRLNSDTDIPLCLALRDERGPYLIGDPGIVTKMFICVCNNCGGKFTGGAFTMRCPYCSSTDFRVEPNW